MIAGSIVTGLAVLAYLLGSAEGIAVVPWIAKPIASTGFVAVAVAAGATRSRYGRAILVALCLSWLGDMLLLPRTPGWFLAGLVAFLLGHLAFCGAFVSRGVNLRWSGTALVPLLVASGLAATWLLPHVPVEMKVPVLAYMSVITLMVALAAGTVGAHGGALILAAAVGFFLSDLSVARDAFVERAFINRLWGLPLYYAAQVAFAWTIPRE